MMESGNEQQVVGMQSRLSAQSAGRDVSRRGVALIVVLGFLSIMVMMAVAFLTHARMERMVSDSSLDAQRGRQLVRTALNAAMNDYSRYLASPGNYLIIPVTPEDQLFTSVAPSAAFAIGGGRVIGDDNVELLVGEAMDWIPRVYTNPPYLAQSVVNENAEWILVREDPSQSQSRILGRYAYAIFDMSGGMDANLVARENEVGLGDSRITSNRVRRSVRQVPMGLLPEVVEGGDYSEFNRLRDGWKGFDSLQMLIKLTDGNPEDGNSASTRWEQERKEINGAGLASNRVSNLTPYSLSAFRGARYNLGSGLWDAYVLVDENTDWATVLDPIGSQFEAGWKDWINDAIYDYTSPSVVPRRTDYPSPKNVPMFNEIAGALQLTESGVAPSPGYPAGGSTYELQMDLDVEFWYPFPSQDNAGGSFSMPPPTVGGDLNVNGPMQIWMRVALQTPGGPNPFEMVELRPRGAPTPVTVTANYNNGRPSRPGDSPTFRYQFDIVRSPASPDPLPPGGTLIIQSIRVLQPIYLTAGGGNADMIPEDLNLSGAQNLSQANRDATFYLEATDPRLNHLPGQWAVPTGNDSMNAMNTWSAEARARYLAEGTNMYSRNGPMETPAEIGFISTGQEWETIDICTEEAVEVLATLVTDTNLFFTGTGGLPVWSVGSSVFYTNGTINPNSRISNVLASAFYDLATQETPNTSTDRVGANPVTEEIAYDIAAQILQFTAAGTIDTAFQAGTDWAQIPAMQKEGRLANVHNLNNNRREALVRNTWGLFNPDNSLFTVVVIAQAIKEGPNNVGLWNDDDDLIVGERRAVALVWRDPFKTGQNLHHEMFVRMIRHLND